MAVVGLYFSRLNYRDSFHLRKSSLGHDRNDRPESPFPLLVWVLLLLGRSHHFRALRYF
jgi:hypothetical protein